jgi:NAD(P)H-dependent FMN reductase
MVTIIQATNRPDSNTEFVSRHIGDILMQQGHHEIRYVSMANLPVDLMTNAVYHRDSLPESLVALQDENLIPADRFIWILPEYNGSFPGVLKFFIDVLSVRKMDATFRGKKSMLIGLATGRSGNIRGMDHFTSILIHLRSLVFPRLLPVSRINELMDEQGSIYHEPTLRALEDHIREFMAF